MPMKGITSMVATLAGLALIVSTASAQRQGPSGQPRQAASAGPLFRLFDIDGDGALTGDEFDKAAAKLRELDTTKDGKLTADEFRAQLRFSPVAPGGRPSRPGGPGGRPGGYGFEFGGTSEHDRPPLAKSDEEKRILAVLDRMSKGRWYLNVTAREGRVLRQLTEAVGAKRVVEIGTSSGYSTIWLALALRSSGGRVFTHEIDPEKVKMARENFKNAGVDDLITVIEGDAHETVKQHKEPIDVVFLDAEKKGYLDYLNKLLPLVRRGGLILAHDMNRPRPDPRYIEAITTDPKLESSFVLMESFGIAVTLKKR